MGLGRRSCRRSRVAGHEFYDPISRLERERALALSQARNKIAVPDGPAAKGGWLNVVRFTEPLDLCE